MKRNGSFDVLMCSEVPSCALYGLGKPPEPTDGVVETTA